MASSSSIFTLAWVEGAGERAIKSFVQGGVTGLIGSGALNASASNTVINKVPDFLALPWYAALSTGILMGILSIATSVLQPDFTAGTPTDVAPVVDDSASTDDVDEEDTDDDEDTDDSADVADPAHAADDEGDTPVTGDDPSSYVDGTASTGPDSPVVPAAAASPATPVADKTN